MHIYIIGRYLNPPGPGEDRLMGIGRYWAGQGHKVTVFLPASGRELNLAGKAIELTEEDGLVLVAFNVPGAGKEGKRIRRKGDRIFCRLLGSQGRQLPEPGVILAVAPPLSTAGAAGELRRELNVPLILEVREGFAEEAAGRGYLAGLFARSTLRKEENLLASASAIAVEGKNAAARIEARLPEESKNKVKILEGRESNEELITFYDCLLPGEGKYKKND